ncbi:MAG: hypothetical protein GWO20_12380, partial [Candidatus Korarchaeota archaeon]|nr:hypothetical protein [Candidatus Korarchaeota archaeon]
MEELWNWKRCKAEIRSLKGRLGFPDKPVLRFLKLSLKFEDGSIYDELANHTLKQKHLTLPHLYCILSSYADAEPTPPTSNLISSKQLQGGQYCNVAVERARSSIQDVFGSVSKMLVKSAKVL